MYDAAMAETVTFPGHGADDRYPSSDRVAQLERELVKHDKTYEFHTYEGAGRAFFAVELTEESAPASAPPGLAASRR
jgi:dienelactone hydrolase